MNMRETLDKYFTASYWAEWVSEFGHNFFDAHINRTIGYDYVFVKPRLSDKKILEVGGYPGLLMSLYLERGCRVTAIDSPRYRPLVYLEWCEKHGIRSIPHDISTGAPDWGEHFDAAVVSDVFLHMEGFPSRFLKWLIENCDSVYLINYSEGGDDHVRKDIEGHTLKAGFTLPLAKVIEEEMNKLGADLVFMDKVEGRDILEFRKRQ
jgi:hypothetical protein